MTEITATYHAATNSVALFDLSDRAQIELRGADRQAFLHNFCTNDIKSLQPGQGCEAFLTNIKGRILGHIIVSATDESLWLDSVPGSNEFIVGHLDKYLITEDVEIIDHTHEVGPLCLVGPESEAWLSDRISDVSTLSVWGQSEATVDGVEVIIRRVTFTVPAAFELVVAHDRRDALRDYIVHTGVASGDAESFDALRIEAGFPHYDNDLTDENIAQEAGRTSRAISFTKGCYLGQEPIARLDAMGHTNKELRRLDLAEGPVPETGTVVKSLDGDDVGRITSAAISGKGYPVALAMLKSSVMTPGTEVVVGETSSIVVVSTDS